MGGWWVKLVSEGRRGKTPTINAQFYIQKGIYVEYSPFLDACYFFMVLFWAAHRVLTGCNGTQSWRFLDFMAD